MRKLVVEDDVEQGTVNLHSAVVMDEAQFAEFVHEEVHSTAGGAHQFGQCFLRYIRYRRFRLPVLAILREQQQRAGQPLLGGIEKLIHQIRLHFQVTFQHVGDESVSKCLISVKRLLHLFLLDNH